MTITKAAKILQLDLPAPKEGNEFGVELPEEIDTRLNDLTLTAEMLEDKTDWPKCRFRKEHWSCS